MRPMPYDRGKVDRFADELKCAIRAENRFEVTIEERGGKSGKSKTNAV